MRLKRAVVIGVMGAVCLLIMGCVLPSDYAEWLEDQALGEMEFEYATEEEVPSEPYFPQVAGRDVNGQPYVLPQDLEGRYNLVLMAFERWQQGLVNTWLPEARALEADYPVRVYEVPTIARLSQRRQNRLDFWMSMGIRDPILRATTITLYTDLDRMQEALMYPDMSTIRLFLIDREGTVYWSGEGGYTAENLEAIRSVLATLAGTPS